MAKPPPRIFTSEDVMHLAFAAHRVKNGYSSSVVYPYNDEKYYDRFTNKNLMLFELVPQSRGTDYTGVVRITEEDKKNVEEMYKFFRRLSFDILGNDLSDFEKSMAEVVISKTISENQLGVAAIVPKVFFDRVEKRDFNTLIKGTTQEWLGTIGESYLFEMVLIKQKFVEKLGFYEHTGITNTNHLVGFISQFKFGVAGDAIKVTGKVKSHGTVYGSDILQTNVNYVKTYRG